MPLGGLGSGGLHHGKSVKVVGGARALEEHQPDLGLRLVLSFSPQREVPRDLGHFASWVGERGPTFTSPSPFLALRATPYFSTFHNKIIYYYCKVFGAIRFALYKALAMVDTSPSSIEE